MFSSWWRRFQRRSRFVSRNPRRLASPRRSFLQVERLEAREVLSQSALTPDYGQLPLAFEANQGQTDPSVAFLSRGPGYGLFLMSREAVLSLEKPAASDDPGQLREEAVLRMRLLDASPLPSITGVDELLTKTNYLSDDPSQSRMDVPTYGKVRYAEVYPGIDLIYYGNQRQLEYDFVVAPGADPSRIHLAFQGAEEMNLDEQGNLVLHTAAGDVIEHAPILYQEHAGTRQSVEGHYVLDGDGQVRFAVGPYDTTRPLTIDPILAYSTYLGGTDMDATKAIAVDDAGHAYVTGVTKSADFPSATPTAPFPGGSVPFVAKLNASGTALLYFTYLAKSNTVAYGIALDSSGNAYITGGNLFAPYSGFVAKLNPSGTSLLYSTSLSSIGRGIALDISGNAYIAGDAFAMKLDTQGSVVYTFNLSGNNVTQGRGIAVDSTGNAYVVGTTKSTNFPTVNAIQPSLRGQTDAFISKINPSGTGLVYSTYLGGATGSGPDINGFVGTGIDIATAVALDSSGNVYVTGNTSSTDFPVQNPIQPALASPEFQGFYGRPDAFVTELNATGTALVYSTYLGGGAEDESQGIAVDAQGSAYIAGGTRSLDFPTVNPVDVTNYIFVTKLAPGGTGILHSSTLQPRIQTSGTPLLIPPSGLAIDRLGNAYVTGELYSPVLLQVNPLQRRFTSGAAQSDSFVLKLAVVATNVTLTSLSPPQAVEGSGDIVLTLNGSGFTNSATVLWDGRPLATTFVSSTQVQATVPASLLADETMVAVAVVNPDESGGSLVYTVADAPLTANGVPVSALVNRPFSGVVAHFTDANPNGSVSDFTASIKWGDGITSPGMVVPSSQGGFDVTGTHTYTLRTTFTIQVTINDKGGSTATASSTATLQDPPPLTLTANNIQARQNFDFSGIVAHLSNPVAGSVPNDYTSTIDWGDSTSSPGTILTNSQGGLDVSGGHIYRQAGMFTFTVSLRYKTDTLDKTATASATATVTSAALLTVTGNPISATTGTPFFGVVATLTTTNPSTVSGDFTVTINWGDTGSSPGTVTPRSGGGFNISGTHTYQQAGTFTITIQVQDNGGNQGSGTTTATVSNAPISGTSIPISTSKGTLYTGPVATFSSTNPNATASDFTVTIDWGDGTTRMGTITASGAGFTVQSSHVYTQDGTFTVTTLVRDTNGNSASITGTATVSRPPFTGTTIYDLRSDSTLWRNTGSGWTQVDSQVQSFGVIGTTVYYLKSAYTLLSYNGTSYTVLDRAVLNFTVAGSIVYDLEISGHLWAYNGVQWSLMDPSVQSFTLVGSTVYALKNDQTLLKFSGSIGTQIASRIASIATAASNLYAVDTSNTLSRYNGSTFTVIDGTTQAIVGIGNILYDLETNGQLWQYDGSTFTQIASRVFNIVGTRTTLFTLQSDGLVQTLDAAGWTTLDTNGRAFGLIPGIDVLTVLESNGDLRQWNGVRWTLITTSVKSFVTTYSDGMYFLTTTGRLSQTRVGGGGGLYDSSTQAFTFHGTTLYDLETNGELWTYSFMQPGAWKKIDQHVQSIAFLGATLYDLETNGQLWTFNGATWTLIDNQVQAIYGNGAVIYALQASGTVWKYEAAGRTQIDTLVQMAALGPGGFVLDVLEYSSDLRQYNGSVWSTLDTTVQSFTVSGAYLYDLQVRGHLWRYDGTSWVRIATGVQSFVARDATVYTVEAGNTLRQYVGTAGTTLDTAAQSIALGTDNMLYELQTNGTLRSYNGTTWSIVDSAVRNFGLIGPTPASQYIYVLGTDGRLRRRFLNSSNWTVVDPIVQSIQIVGSTLYDLETNGQLWRYQDGTWYLLETNVRSFLAAPLVVTVLQNDGTLKQNAGSGFVVLRTMVQTFVLGPGGFTVDALDTSGNLWQYNGTTWTLLDSQVLFFTLGNGGYTLFVTKTDGSQKQFPA